MPFVAGTEVNDAIGAGAADDKPLMVPLILMPLEL